MRRTPANKRNLLQPDLLNNPDPAPPAALLSVYGAKAQMLGSLFNDDGFLQGWISVRFLDGPQALSDADVAALDAAKAEAAALLDLPAPGSPTFPCH